MQRSVYLSGPMRGVPKSNFPLFDLIAAKWLAADWYVVSPADMDRKAKRDKMLTGEKDEPATYAKRDLRILLGEDVYLDGERFLGLQRNGEDGIALLPGWNTSKGARAELAVAQWIGLRVYDAGQPGQPAVLLEAEVPPLTEVAPVHYEDGGAVRAFETGATRTGDQGRYDPEGYLSPLVLERYSEFMLKHQIQANGEKRASDNWQKGMSRDSYMKGQVRHTLHAWLRHRGWPVRDPKAAPNLIEDLMAVIFNASGYAHEILRTGGE